jgi:hypothetical protein
MTTLSKTQIALLTAGAMLIVWQHHQSATRSSQLASVRAELEARQRELDFGQTALDQLAATNHQLQQAETGAGNHTLLALTRERAAFTRAANESTPQNQGVGAALAQVLDSPEQRQADEEHLRNQIRAGMGTFFRLADLPPDRVEQYIDLSVELERRKAARLSALLHGTMSVADAIRERDNDQLESEKRQREVLGDSANQFLDGIADSMRNEEAKRLVKLIQQNMGNNALTQEQSERLQPLIKTEIMSINMDDVELFRPPNEWARQCTQHQENVLQAAADFLTAAQIETLRVIASYDLADRQKRMAARRQSLGIN